MCSPQAAGVIGAIAGGAGNVMQQRAQAQNQIGQYDAQTQAMNQTNDRQQLLRALERDRQNQMSAGQQQAFSRAMQDAAPEQMQAREQQLQQERQDLAARVRSGMTPDVALPGTSIPGGSGVMDAANRTVQTNLDQDAEQLASTSAALQAFPEGLNRLGQMFQGPQFNIDRLGVASQRSRGLLPGELDAARIAPRIPAAQSSDLGQLLSAAGPMLMNYYGQYQGRDALGRQYFNQANQYIPSWLGGSG